MMGKRRIVWYNQFWLVGIVLFVLFSQSCNTGEQRVIEATDSVQVPVNITTEYVFHPLENLPADIYIDSLRLYDSLRRAWFDLHFIQSHKIAMAPFNSDIRLVLNKLVETEKRYLDPRAADDPVDPAYAFVLGGESFYTDGKVLSFSCIIDTYGEGGNHHNYSWFCFNYDLENMKVLCFDEVFTLKGRKDSLAFAGLLSRNPADGRFCSEVTVPFDSVGFSFTEKGMVFYPDLLWACGIQEFFVPGDSIRRYLKD